MAGILREVGKVLPRHQETRAGSLLQGILHVSELRPPHPSDDIHDQLDRETPEGLPEGDEDARGDAKRRVCTAAYGQDSHGQEVIPEAGAENQSRQDPIPGLMKTAEVKLPRLLYFQTKLIHLQTLKNLRTQNGHTK